MQATYPVSAVLQQKNLTLWSIGPDTLVIDAIKMMAEKNIGALLVLGGRELLGVFTERDYTRKIALAGKSSRDTRVREVMTGRVITVAPGDSVTDCMRLMTEHRVRHLPVLTADQVVGIVSIGDLVNWIISTQNAAIEQMEQYITGSHAP